MQTIKKLTIATIFPCIVMTASFGLDNKSSMAPLGIFAKCGVGKLSVRELANKESKRIDIIKENERVFVESIDKNGWCSVLYGKTGNIKNGYLNCKYVKFANSDQTFPFDINKLPSTESDKKSCENNVHGTDVLEVQTSEKLIPTTLKNDESINLLGSLESIKNDIVDINKKEVATKEDISVIKTRIEKIEKVLEYLITDISNMKRFEKWEILDIH